MIRKRLKKSAKKVRSLVPDNVAEHANNLNPLTKREEEPASLERVPQITNETIAAHREDVLRGARKYIYPLQHSKRRIVVLTSGILVVAIIILLVYSILGLYKFNQYNTFLYRTSQVVPFPAARIGDTFVAYENYLFELRHYVHYYETQLGSNFEGSERDQLLNYRKQALNDVIRDAYVKILAEQNKVSVSNKEVDQRIALVRNQNRLGSNDKVFADVLKDYWGWSIVDFKRSLKQQVLADKVVAKLDVEDSNLASSTLIKLKKGANFSDVAAKVSDDQGSKTSGGDYGFAITKNNPNVPPEVIEALFSMRAGQLSGVINTGDKLEIVKVIEKHGNSVTAKHIVIDLKDISEYTNALKAKRPVHTFVRF